MSLEMLLKNIAVYNNNQADLETVKRAYGLASDLHGKQVRESGEPYISHPSTVAYILSEMQADVDTIVAGLLHDAIEDSPLTKEDIAQYFNADVANLVDGVTKISKLNFSSKEEQTLANKRKIITSIILDVRIILIKLVDRLHNMRTLGFKSEFKQKENSLETMEIFVPLAYYIGAYQIKSELEDLSLRYLKPDVYKSIEDKKVSFEEESKPCVEEMLYKIGVMLNDKNIPGELKFRTKNIYNIYRKLSENRRMTDIHDLLALKIILDDVDNCYRTLAVVHQAYRPINSRFKDYIGLNAKTNMYESLHTTVFGPDERLVQIQMRTGEMDRVAEYGLSAHWGSSGVEARIAMQEDLTNKCQFAHFLVEINGMFGDNKGFVSQIKAELFSDKVYVHTMNGEVIELPKGSTLIDFAYQIHTDVGNTAVGAIVNGEHVSLKTVLKNKDRVKIITDPLSFGPKEEWLGYVKTSHAAKEIKKVCYGLGKGLK